MSSIRMVFLDGILLHEGSQYKFEMKNTGTGLRRILKLKPEQAKRHDEGAALEVLWISQAEVEQVPIEVLEE